MEFTIDSFPLIIDKFECVTSVSIHVAVAVWSTTVTEQEWYLKYKNWKKKKFKEAS